MELEPVPQTPGICWWPPCCTTTATRIATETLSWAPECANRDISIPFPDATETLLYCEKGIQTLDITFNLKMYDHLTCLQYLLPLHFFIIISHTLLLEDSYEPGTLLRVFMGYLNLESSSRETTRWKKRDRGYLDCHYSSCKRWAGIWIQICQPCAFSHAEMTSSDSACDIWKNSSHLNQLNSYHYRGHGKKPMFLAMLKPIQPSVYNGHDCMPENPDL